MVERLRAYFLDSDSAGGRRRRHHGDVRRGARELTRCRRSISPRGSRRSSKFLALPEAASLTAANKRISNILKKADAGGAGHRRRRPRCASPPRRRCTKRSRASSPKSNARSRKRDYSAALARLATLRPAVDGFFDGVMVNAEDPALRRNRLALLAQLRHQFTRIADLSCLPG